MTTSTTVDLKVDLMMEGSQGLWDGLAGGVRVGVIGLQL